MSRASTQKRLTQKRLLAVTLVFACAASGPATALDLRFPGEIRSSASALAPQSSLRLAIGPYAAGTLPTRLAEGAMEQTAYRIALAQPSTLELIQPLRDQLTTAGFSVIFECETDACGGFDFRFGTNVLPEPDMHVDLGDFRYLAAERGAEIVALMVSRSAQDGFVQVTTVGGNGAKLPLATTAGKSPGAAQAMPVDLAPDPDRGRSVPGLADLGKRLELGQSQVLEDLVFASGSSALAEGDYVSLAALAEWLKASANRRVTLVGHTDASGGLAGNIRLSQLRAESVRQHLLFAHKVAPDQVQAEGVGYLAPRDSNQTEDGRRKNRRVEAIATSTELLAP